MRRSLLWAALAAVLLGPSVTTVRGQGQSAPRQSGTNVAVIDIGQVFEQHVRFKRMMDDIKRDIDKFDAELTEQKKALRSQAETLKTLQPSSAEYKALESRLAKADADLQVKASLKRKEILMREAENYYDAYREVVQHVAEFADRYQIGLVLAFNSKPIDPSKRDSVIKGVNRTVVFQRNLNITQLILERLNNGIMPRDANTRNKPPLPGRPGIR